MYKQERITNNKLVRILANAETAIGYRGGEVEVNKRGKVADENEQIDWNNLRVVSHVLHGAFAFGGFLLRNWLYSV